MIFNNVFKTLLFLNLSLLSGHVYACLHYLGSQITNEQFDHQNE